MSPTETRQTLITQLVEVRRHQVYRLERRPRGLLARLRRTRGLIDRMRDARAR